MTWIEKQKKKNINSSSDPTDSTDEGCSWWK